MKVDFVADVGGASAINGTTTTNVVPPSSSARPPLASRQPTKLPKISSGANKPAEASKRDEEQVQP